jgi:4-amino-4-deoxy-L-arabinose transferase-like glycosyltransferase
MTWDSVLDNLRGRRLWMWLGGIVFVRLIMMLVVVNGADLAGDEAYYWDWGRRPDWGYYSKPPMIGWMMGVIGWLTGNAEWGIRFTALLLGLVTLLLTWRLAYDLLGERVAGFAALLMVLTPGNAGLCLLLTIDAPLLLAWTCGLWLYWRAAQAPEKLFHWLLLGLVIGCGCLSKQMMLVFPLLMIIFAALSAEDRGLLRRPGFWIAAVLGLLFIGPVLWWNGQHGWITLEHTKHHFDSSSTPTFSKWLGRIGENIGLQALVYTPMLFIAMIAALWCAFRGFRRLSRPMRYLWLCAGPALACFALLALRQRINPNWPAAFFVPAIILAAAWMLERGREGWRRWSLRIACGMTVIIHVALIVAMSTDLKTINKVASLRGWREVGIEADAWLQKMPELENTFVMAVGHRYHAAWMAFYMPSHPRIYRWEASGVPQSQYEVWPGPEECIGKHAMILVPKGLTEEHVPQEVRTSFEKLEHVGAISIPMGSEKREFGVFRGVKLKTWKAIRQS